MDIIDELIISYGSVHYMINDLFFVKILQDV
jgi:hypothetical protein